MIHEHYEPKNRSHDIALIKLKRPMKLADYGDRELIMSKIPMPMYDEIHDELILGGWGPESVKFFLFFEMMKNFIYIFQQMKI